MQCCSRDQVSSALDAVLRVGHASLWDVLDTGGQTGETAQLGRDASGAAATECGGTGHDESSP